MCVSAPAAELLLRLTFCSQISTLILRLEQWDKIPPLGKALKHFSEFPFQYFYCPISLFQTAPLTDYLEWKENPSLTILRSCVLFSLSQMEKVLTFSASNEGSSVFLILILFLPDFEIFTKIIPHKKVKL